MNDYRILITDGLNESKQAILRASAVAEKLPEKTEATPHPE